ncbi:MAG TPA: hypothetical protein VG273_16435 [Bryobacteraceae bacterium]|nr:hypothetical protein [Bryobacteraceae bacterium]
MTPQPPIPDTDDQEPEDRPTQEQYQLKLPQSELSRLGTRVLTDYRSALADHNRRIQRFRELYRRWRAMTDTPNQGEETASNFPVPFVRWNIFTKWAKEIDALFGDDAEIVAVPVGPSDYRKDKKIGRYMTWRVFNSMKLLGPICEFVLRKLVFGRSVAYSPWKRETYEVKGEEVVDYEGPGFEPLWPDDIIVPAEDVRSIHEFSFAIRRYRVTPDQLLRGEEEGRYQNIKKNWHTIVNLALHGQQRDFEGEDIKLEKDNAEGVLYQRPLSSGEWVMVLEWYGRWRPLKKGVGKSGGGSAKDAGEYDFDKREMKQRDFVVRYLYDLNMVIGVQDLETLYPHMRQRRPFVESSMLKAGEYWSPGMAEMLLDIEDELRANHNQTTEAAQLSITPTVMYRPASGFNPETFRMEPGMAIPVDDPSRDVKELKITANIEAATWKEQVMLGYGEKLTGLSDMQLGRQSDRPNAPRTATQTVKLLEEGNVRISLDTKVLQEDMRFVLEHFWELEYEFSPDETFFRVTEEDADGLFPVNSGGSILSYQERDGRYDFRLQFANSVWSKEVKKQQALARYQLDLQNPLIAQNPRALWQVTRDAHDALGDPNFAELVPEPPAPDLPVDPREEWNRLLQGEDIHVNPMDNDQLHLQRHMQDLKKAEADTQCDPDAIQKLVAHYRQHILQLQQKKINQAIVEQAVNAVAGIAGGQLAFPHGLFGGSRPVKKGDALPTGLQGNPAQTGPAVFSQHPEIQHEE